MTKVFIVIEHCCLLLWNPPARTSIQNSFMQSQRNRLVQADPTMEGTAGEPGAPPYLVETIDSPCALETVQIVSKSGS